MDKLKKKIDLAALSDEEIAKKEVSLSNLWMIKDENNNVFGPFDTQSLKIYIAKHQHLFTKTKIYNLESETWHSTFSIGHFQRRKSFDKDQSVELAGNEFYISLNKQQSGPYTQDEVQAFLNNGQLKPDSLISIDKGESWIKLYEHHAFDRRAPKTNQELPFVPDQSILDQMANTKDEIIKLREQEDAIAQLAFIGHQKDDSTSKVNIDESPKQSFKLNKQLKIMFASVVSVALVFGLFLTNMDKFFSSSESTIETGITVDKSKRSIKRAPAKTVKKAPKRVKPRKFTRTVKPKKLKPKRTFPNRTPKRTVVRAPKRDRFEQKNEEIDINDPEIQDEITRQLAGENDLDSDSYDDEEEDEYNIEERMDDYMGDEDPYEHGPDDY